MLCVSEDLYRDTTHERLDLAHAEHTLSSQTARKVEPSVGHAASQYYMPGVAEDDCWLLLRSKLMFCSRLPAFVQSTLDTCK